VDEMLYSKICSEEVCNDLQLLVSRVLGCLKDEPVRLRLSKPKKHSKDYSKETSLQTESKKVRWHQETFVVSSDRLKQLKMLPQARLTRLAPWLLLRYKLRG
jgi:hypothetical protein